MQRLWVWALGIVISVLFTAVVIPIGLKFLELRGFYDQPRETVGPVLNFFLSLAEQTWLRNTALVLGGFVAGLSVDWLLRKLDGSRIEARKNLGIEMQTAGREIQSASAHGSDLWVNIGPLNAGPRLNACFLKARKIGLWAPDDRIFQVQRPFGDRIQHTLLLYLMHVGTLLSDGHFAEAKHTALQAKEPFAEIVAEDEKTKQEQKARQRG
jgi:hypothetical protein